MVVAAGQRAAKLAAAAGRAQTIAPADGRHRVVHRRLSRRVVRAVLSRAEIHREISGPGRGAHRTAALRAVRVFVRAAAVEQSHHRLHEFVPQPGDGVSAVAAGPGPDHFPLEIHRIHGAGVVGVCFFDCAAAGGVRFVARGAVAFLSGDAGVDCAVHRAAGRAGRGAGDLGSGGIWTGAVFKSP